MTRNRILLLAGLVLAAGGFYLAGSSLQAADPVDTLNPPVKTKPVGPALQQPIHYSHKVHAGTLEMDCGYCHTNVDKSGVANIPNVETCMNCHNYVKQSKEPVAGLTVEQTKAEISRLTQYYASGQSIPWRNVTFLPDHVNFNHKRHVKAGVSCFTCHGRTPDMDVVYTVNKINMGFCVTCHKNNRENKDAPASLDCYTCHK